MAKIKCAICGKKVDSSFAVCPDCGSPVESGPAAHSIRRAHKMKTSPQGANPKPFIIAAYIPVIIFFVAVLVFVIVMFSLTATSFFKNFGTGRDNDDIDDFDPDSSISVIVGSDEDEDDHNHIYKSVITKQATCKESGERTFTCDCGHSYTKAIATTPHNFAAATCSSPRKCSVCGTTSGSPLTHSYMQGKCVLCGGTDPKASAAINGSSLSLPALPKTVTHSLGGTNIATATISGVSYEFGYEATGTVSLTVTLSGKINSSAFGSGQTTAQVGYTLYGPDGQQFKSGTILISGTVGAEFTSRGNTLLYSFDNAPVGKYRLELSDTK